MKTLGIMLSAMLIFSATAMQAEDRAAAPQAKQLGGRIVKPIAPVGQPTYKVSIEAKPKFPKEERPKASDAVTEKGLTVTIQPEKKTFAGNGPLSFEVTLTNASKDPFLLYRGATLGEGAKLTLSNQKSAAQWEPELPAVEERGGTVSLPPGKSVTYYLVVEQQFVAIPIPRPLPQPLPRALPEKAGAALQIQDARRRPAIIAVPFVGPEMPCGQGTIRAKLLLEFHGDPLGKYATPLWTGKIATNTVEFEVGAPQPVNPPVIGPPIAGPLTREQAVVVAQAVAERALEANYQPLDPVRPPHAGNWIENPAKTADVKEQKGGGWKVSWTQVPTGKGFRFNVTVQVNTGGGAQVTEVFTGYSAR